MSESYYAHPRGSAQSTDRRADANYLFGRSFRPCWLPNGAYLCCLCSRFICCFFLFPALFIFLRCLSNPCDIFSHSLCSLSCVHAGALLVPGHELTKVVSAGVMEPDSQHLVDEHKFVVRFVQPPRLRTPTVTSSSPSSVSHFISPVFHFDFWSDCWGLTLRAVPDEDDNRESVISSLQLFKQFSAGEMTSQEQLFQLLLALAGNPAASELERAVWSLLLALFCDYEVVDMGTSIPFQRLLFSRQRVSF